MLQYNACPESPSREALSHMRSWSKTWQPSEPRAGILMGRGAGVAALCACLAALLVSREEAQLCYIGPASEGWENHPAYADLFDAMVTTDPLWEGGPSLGGEPLLDVLGDPSGAVGALPVLDGRELADGGPALTTAKRLQSALAPFVVRGWAPALALGNSSWMAPETRLGMRDAPGTAWSWRGLDYIYYSAGGGSAAAAERDAVRVTSNRSESTLGAFGASRDVEPGRAFWLEVPGAEVDDALRSGTMPLFDGTLGQGTSTTSYRVVRTGRGAYKGNWHVDYLNNWIVDHSTNDYRVVVAHPASADRCFRVERDPSSSLWRQSLCPREPALLREWLRTSCGGDDDDDLRWLAAAQHRFRQGQKRVLQWHFNSSLSAQICQKKTFTERMETDRDMRLQS